MVLEWSDDALADLDRFAVFLRDTHPLLAGTVASAIIERAEILAQRPLLGQPIAGSQVYRQVILQAMGATYIFQYRYDGERLVMLRVFHGSENRE